jgi:hypothetical protein
VHRVQVAAVVKERICVVGIVREVTRACTGHESRSITIGMMHAEPRIVIIDIYNIL